MSKVDKKSPKQQTRRIQQLKKQQDEIKMKQELSKLKQQQEQLRNSSSPLVQYGLLDAYSFFLKNLAENGLPQPNIFQFAAQSVLKFQKKIKKKTDELKKIDDYNRSVIQNQKKAQTSPTKKKLIKSNMLPFKGEVNQDQLNILNKLNPHAKIKTKQNYQNQEDYDSGND